MPIRSNVNRFASIPNTANGTSINTKSLADCSSNGLSLLKINNKWLIKAILQVAGGYFILQSNPLIFKKAANLKRIFNFYQATKHVLEFGICD